MTMTVLYSRVVSRSSQANSLWTTLRSNLLRGDRNHTATGKEGGAMENNEPGRSPMSSPDLSSGLMAGAEGRLAPFAVTILASGYDNGPAAGPVGVHVSFVGVLDWCRLAQ